MAYEGNKPTDSEVAADTQVVEEVIKSQTVEEQLNTLSNKYGVSVSVAKAIIMCESQFIEDAVMRNYRHDSIGEKYLWSSDWGYFQINDYYWQEYFMSEMGLDILDPADNLEAGFWLLSRSGTAPWSASKRCHGL